MIKLDPSKPVQTKEGRQAQIKYTFKNGYHFIIFSDTDGWIIVDEWGEYDREETEYGIINTPERVEGWVNIYRNNRPVLHGMYSNTIYFDSKSEADKNAHWDRIACIKISYTVGEGL
ncbi:MAG: hypothetical protein A2W23_06535 [Planctomycetes bacterium RBG_16_43_13]|nr:MAG: hypothetical protein A2W23_06535 [Planctomycetes bacterium RBG_16_43_13]